MQPITPTSYMKARRDDLRRVHIERDGTGWLAAAHGESPEGVPVAVRGGGPSIDMALDEARMRWDRITFAWGQRLAASQQVDALVSV